MEFTQTYSFQNPKTIPSDSSKQVIPTRFWKWFNEGNFQSFSVIARGFFGQVQKARFKDEQALKNNRKPTVYANQWAALKYPLGKEHNFEEQFNSLSHEVSCTLILHSSLVNYIGGLSLGNPNRVGVIMEFMDTNLREAIERDDRLQDEITCFQIAKEIAAGMNFLHSLNPYIVHRDLRTPNILVNNKLECKIGDFGMSNNLGYGEIKPVAMYTRLIPPECLNLNISSFGKEGDVYFFGWILVELALKKRPNEHYKLEEVYSFFNEKYPFNEFKNLVFSCLEKDKYKRITFFDICIQLNNILKVNLDIELFAQSKDASVIEKLQSNEIRSYLLNYSDSLERKLVHQFCIYGNLNGLKALISIQGKECLHFVDKYNTTCAHFSARNGFLEILKLLQENDFTLFNEKEKRFSSNPLNLAIAMKHSECVKFLASFADQESLDNGLISACTEGQIEFVKLFLEKGADVQSRDSELKMSPLAWATDGNHFEIVQYLIDNGANINEGRFATGSTPLYIASQNGNVQLVKYLIESGSNVNKARTTDKSSPLYISSQNNYSEIVEILLQNKADPNICMKKGDSPLIIASYFGYIEIVSLLIEWGANITHKNENNETALDCARNKNHTKVVELLEAKLQQIKKKGKDKNCEEIVEKGEEEEES